MNTNGAHVQLTSSLKPKTREAFQAGQVERCYPKGRVVFGEGETSDGIYLIHSGRVKLFRTENGTAGSPRIARPGEILGLSTVITGRGSDATAETLGPSRLSFIPRDTFMKLMHHDADFAFGILRTLCESLRDPFDRFRSPHRRRRRRTSKV